MPVNRSPRRVSQRILANSHLGDQGSPLAPRAELRQPISETNREIGTRICFSCLAKAVATGSRSARGASGLLFMSELVGAPPMESVPKPTLRRFDYEFAFLSCFSTLLPQIEPSKSVGKPYRNESVDRGVTSCVTDNSDLFHQSGEILLTSICRAAI